MRWWVTVAGRRRAWPALVLAGLLVAAVLLSSAGAGTREILTRTYDCSTAITTLISSNANRRTLTLINVGTIHAGLSGQMHTNATLAANGFFTLHAGSTIELLDFQGGLTCTAAGAVRLGVMEEF